MKTNEFDDIFLTEEGEKEQSIIKVIGVGGGGSNAVNQMYRQGIEGVDFIVCNTDAQALNNSPVGIKIQLGKSLTEGRGAGNIPEIGRNAAIETAEEIQKLLEENTRMVFITAGMGGGTGTGATPVIAKVMKEMGVLTIGIVTIPFHFEGKIRIDQAYKGVQELQKQVDALLIIHNEKLRQMYGNLPLSEAFKNADNVLSVAAKSIAEIITVPGYINVDFADVETVMRDSGVAIMGSASAAGENRAIEAVNKALTSPLLNSSDISGAKHVLLNMISGENEISMSEVAQITEYINKIVGSDVDVIWGNGFDKRYKEEVNVTVIVTGFELDIRDRKIIKPQSMINSKKENSDFELIIENPQEVERKAKKKRKPKNIKPKEKETLDIENVNNWFKKKFSQVFDDKDTKMN